MSWAESATNIRWTIHPFINGRSRPSVSAEVFDKINPANETRIYQLPVGDAADVNEAVSVARQRFEDGCWSQMPPGRRAAILMQLADLIVRQKQELALLDTVEMGKPISAALNEIDNFAAPLLRSWAGLADKLFGASAPLSRQGLALNTYQPRGVVGAITPWNFPMINALIKLAPALAAGNTVVLKPSELTPSSALKVAELALEAGVPEGVLNVVPGLGSTVGTALALHHDVDLLSFTGSTMTGRKIMELAACSNGKPLVLECGGKSPHVVFSDVSDLEYVAEAAARSVLYNQGQICTAHTRLIVHEDIKDTLLAEVVSRASRYAPGDPLDESTTFGPLASPAQRDRVKSYVEQGLRAGAVAVLKGTIQERDGCFVSPTIFDRVDGSMSIAREEIFGPVLTVQSFRTDEEAIALANATDYGLMATVWTRDMGRAKRMAYAIKAGHVAVRTSGAEGPELGDLLSCEPQKASGFGCETGIKALESYSTLKSVSFNGE